MGISLFFVGITGQSTVYVKIQRKKKFAKQMAWVILKKSKKEVVCQRRGRRWHLPQTTQNRRTKMSLLAAQMYTLRDHCKTAVDLA
jgi:hypothetical protein